MIRVPTVVPLELLKTIIPRWIVPLATAVTVRVVPEIDHLLRRNRNAWRTVRTVGLPLSVPVLMSRFSSASAFWIAVGMSPTAAGDAGRLTVLAATAATSADTEAPAGAPSRAPIAFCSPSVNDAPVNQTSKVFEVSGGSDAEVPIGSMTAATARAACSRPLPATRPPLPRPKD